MQDFRFSGGGNTWGATKQASAYVDVICLTIIVYDMMLTLSQEVRLIWGTKWGLTKILYLLSRYFPVLSFSFSVMYDLPTGLLFAITDRRPGVRPRLWDWFLNINLVFVEALFSLRTWAIWNRNQRVGVFLLILFISWWTTTFVLLVLFQVGRLHGNIFCQINFGLLTGFYFCTSALMCLRAYHSSLAPGSSFVRTINLHGVLYYIFLFIFSLCSLIFSTMNRRWGQQALPRVLQLVFTIMVTRMTLNLREAGARVVRVVNSGDSFINISTREVR